MVVAAHHIHLDEKVALKFLLAEALGDAVAVARFAREARSSVKIKSEHVARTLDVGTLENGTPYIVMEYLDGTDLACWLRQRGPLPFDEAIDFVLQAGEALAEAHALGIVHRDLKPANLFCTRGVDGRPTIKVLDFGISKVIAAAGSDSSMGLTRTAALMGFSLLHVAGATISGGDARGGRADRDSASVGGHSSRTADGPRAVPGRRRSPRWRSRSAHAETEGPSSRSLKPTPPRVAASGHPSVPREKDRDRRYGDMAGLALALCCRSRPKRAEASVEKDCCHRAGGASIGHRTVDAFSRHDRATAGGRDHGSAGTNGASPKGRQGHWRRRRGRSSLTLICGVAADFSTAGAVVSSIDGSMNAGSASALRPPTPAVDGAVVLGAIPTTTSASGATGPGRPSRLPPGLMPEPPGSPGSQGTAPATTGSAAQQARRPPVPTFAVPATARASSPKPDCDPPFTLDGNGEKHFKRECYH